VSAASRRHGQEKQKPAGRAARRSMQKRRGKNEKEEGIKFISSARNGFGLSVFHFVSIYYPKIVKKKSDKM
jgi:hypothetical protein